MACIDVKMEKMVNIVEQLSKNETKIEKHKIEKHKEPSELSDLEISNLIKNSKNIKNLDEVFELKEIGILKETEVKPGIDCYYCSICFEGTIPNFEIKSIGSHFFIKTEDDTGEEFQSRVLRNLKSNVKKHILYNKLHKQKKEEIKQKNIIFKELKSRQVKIGLNVFRTRYQGIKQNKSRSSFEEDILKANLNGEDIGDINHSRFFAKDLDKAIYKTMKCDIQDNMNCMLDATQSKRPAGLVMDKMTPNKRTGQIHAIIIPIPENPLTKDLLVPLMLEVPPVHNHSAEGLAESAK